MSTFSSNTSVPSNPPDKLPPHSNDPSEELSRVVLALETWGTSSEKHSMADRYLVSFQRQPIAWVVCEKMLAMPMIARSNATSATSPHSLDMTPTCHFFAAQTLHSKCRNCYAVKGQLPQESLVSLRDSLLQQLFALYLTKLSGPVHTQLAFAISALAIQMGWKEVISFLLTQVQNTESSSNNNPKQREATICMVCDILQFLPEECNSDRLLLERDEEERRYFHNHVFLSYDYEDYMNTPKMNNGSIGMRNDDLSNKDYSETKYAYPSTQTPPRQAKNAQHVFEFLWYLVQTCHLTTPHPQEKIIDKVLQCLCSWIYHVRLPAELLQHSPLVPWVVSLLRQCHGVSTSANHSLIDSDRMDLAVDVLVEILRCYPSDSYWNKGLVKTMYPLILSLGVVLPNSNTLTSATSNTSPTPFEMALKHQDENELRAFTRIFTEMGESYLSLVVGSEEYHQVLFVEVLLTCSSIPDLGKQI